MDIFVTDKLVNVTDGTILGYLVSAGGKYKVAVTKGFGEMRDVQDMAIAEFLDVPCTGVVPVNRSGYAIVDNSFGYVADLADTPMEVIGDNVAIYGYMFSRHHIVPFDSQTAFGRMVAEAKGSLIE